MRASSDDLPAFGRPTRAASASNFNRSSISPSSPGRPTSAKRGVCRVAPAKCLLPRPPVPPFATTTRASACARSATSPPSPSNTCVPTGTFSTASSPSAPCDRRPPPPPPRPARSFRLGRMPDRSRRRESATSTTGLVDDGNEAALAARPERDLAGARREDRVVLADAGPGARAEARAALADEDHSRLYVLAGEELDAEHLRVRVTAVPRRAQTFLVCHLVLLLRSERGHERGDRTLAVRVRLLVL